MSNLADKGKEKVLLFFMEDDSVRRALFSINALKVREILQIPEITAYPGAPSYIKGIISHRGALVPAINLGEFINLENVVEPKLLVVVEYGPQLFGFLVRDVFRVLDIDKQLFEQAKEKNHAIIEGISQYILNVLQVEEIQQLIQVLDLEKIILSLKGSDESELNSVQEIKNSHKVLIVDDSAMSRASIRRVLEKTHLEFIEAEDGDRALDMLTKLATDCKNLGKSITEEIGLVLVDAEMPHMDGYELAKRIKNDVLLKDLPVVMHTALNNPIHFAKVKEAGIDHCLLKFDSMQLAEVIRAFIKY